MGDEARDAFGERMYNAWWMGILKSAAVREAQPFMLAEDGWQHPAFWGAFQRIGKDSPLSFAFDHE